MEYRLLLILLLLGIANTTLPQDRLSGKSFATRSEVLARNGMVATNHPLATQIGIDILKKGGSAIDAAIAANAFLGFADPGMCGIGGDLFAIVWDAKTKQLYGLNASGRSPETLTLSYLQLQKEKGNDLYKGPLTVTTPGCVDGWFQLHSKFGKLPVAELLQPTIRYAQEGVPITQETADFFAMDEPAIKKRNHTNLEKVFFINGRFPRKGEIFKNPGLARTLDIISKKGRAGFYEGEVAAGIELHMKNHGGFLTTNDLKKHQSEWVKPVSVNYRGYDVWELPPNTQGIAALQMLTILEGFNMAAMSYGSTGHIHTLVEAKKLAYEDRAVYYGDPNFNKLPIDSLISKSYGESRRKLIDPAKANIYHAGLGSRNHTVYLTVADKEGNMISLIQSLCSGFGSEEVVDGFGFALQNRGIEFVLDKDHVNCYAPGKRPFHTIMPGFVTKDGNPFLSFGVMGGDMQPQGQVQILLNIIDFGMNVQEAGDAPRIFHDGTKSYTGHLETVGDTFIESGFTMEVIRDLIDKGHNIRMLPGIFGGYQAIMLKDGVYYGASDARKDGHAAGY